MPAAERLWLEITNRLAREVAARVTRTYLAYAAGNVTLQESVGIMATLIATAQRRAVTANDLLLAAEMSEMLERQFDALGVSWAESTEQQVSRLGKAVRDIIDADVEYVQKAKTPEQRAAREAHSIRERLTRLSDGEVTSASQWARQTAAETYEEQGYIRGWYRRLNPGACELCRTLAGRDPEKYIHPVQHKMATHPGCKCSQGWVNEIEPWQVWVGPRKQMKYVSEPATPATAAASSS